MYFIRTKQMSATIKLCRISHGFFVSKWHRNFEFSIQSLTRYIKYLDTGYITVMLRMLRNAEKETSRIWDIGEKPVNRVLRETW